MANTFFQPGEQRAAKVRELFARIARRYDLLNDLQSLGLHRQWKRRLVRLAGAQPGSRALDLCCGTGDLALALARRGAEVTGLDFSREMLAVAQDRSSKSNSDESQAGAQSPKPQVAFPRATTSIRPSTNPSIQSSSPPPVAPAIPRFIQGDAQRIPFRDDSFDIVSVGYGLRNLADWEAGLREMQRVARPGGRLLVLEFGKPDLALWRMLYFAYLRLFVPVLGLVFCGSAGAYAYILESLKHYPAQRGVAARMRDLGLVNVGNINLLGGVMSINYGEKAGGT
jgi:demethylmenaquinone methyltransferase/2-methoxy-6-polyprenyl-1,4-benzoquinol methylase